MKKLVFICALLISSPAWSQISINALGSAPDASAMLDVSSTSKGILVPRMTQAQRLAITTPANGLMVYQTDSGPGFYYNSGTSGSAAWKRIGTESNWSLTGNGSTSSGTNFIGTTDFVSLIFKVNNSVSGKIDPLSCTTSLGYLSIPLGSSGYFNTAIGYKALNVNGNGEDNAALGANSLSSNVSGIRNTAIGSGALAANTGSHNTATGYQSLYGNSTANSNAAYGICSMENNVSASLNTAVGAYSLRLQTYNPGSAWESYNVAVGYEALYYNQPTNVNNGIKNTALGSKSLINNTTGHNNTANGYQTLYNNQTGFSNVAMGTNASYSGTTQSNLVAVGDSALYYNGTGAIYSYQGEMNTAIGSKALYSNNTGYENTAGGYRSLFSNTYGTSNTAFGVRSLMNNTSGYSNTAVGSHALCYTTVGESNIAIGASALFSNTTGSQNIAVGNAALISQNYNPGNSWNGNNVAIGYASLSNNNPTNASSGINNTATGTYSLYNNNIGMNNTAFGQYAMYSNTSGSYNTAVGYNADVSTGTFGDATAIGANAVTTANDKVVIGGPYSGVIVIGGFAGWSTFSDGRFKTDVRQDVPGLDFIEKLNPVTFTVNHDALIDHITQFMPDSVAQRYHRSNLNADGLYHPRLTGFIAQEVEAAARDTGYDFDGVNPPQNTSDNYSLSYASFVVPLVKAVQEQQQQIEVLKAENAALETRLEEVEQKLKK